MLVVKIMAEGLLPMLMQSISTLICIYYFFTSFGDSLLARYCLNSVQYLLFSHLVSDSPLVDVIKRSEWLRIDH